MLLRAKTLSKKVLDVMSWPFFCYPLLQIEESTKLLTLPNIPSVNKSKICLGPLRECKMSRLGPLLDVRDVYKYNIPKIRYCVIQYGAFGKSKFDSTDLFTVPL